MLRRKLPSPNRHSFRWSGVLTLFLLGFIAFSLVATIQLQHHIRHLETQYAKALQQEVALKEEWGKLKLEKHHLTALARVKEIAKTRLDMTLEKHPNEKNAQTIFLRPENQQAQLQGS